MSSYLRRLPTTVAVPAVGSLLAIVVAGALSPDPGTAQASRPAVGIGPAATHTLTLLLTSAVIAALIATVVALAARRLPIIGVLVAAADRVLPMVIVAMSAVAVSVGRGSPVHPVVLAAILAVPAGVALAARLADALSGELRRTSATMARMLGIGPRRLLLRRALPGATLRVVPAITTTVAWLTVAVLVAEPITRRSGLGSLTVAAIDDHDAARLQVLAAVLIVGVTAVGVLGAVARAAADPRIRS